MEDLLLPIWTVSLEKDASVLIGVEQQVEPSVVSRCSFSGPSLVAERQRQTTGSGARRVLVSPWLEGG
jgi:hypothetical protein